ncbi:MAG: hypothetical protein UZ21_OP11001000349 [Microgenomates bacterium OLB22]|nr:MAG: hypothetical protein UZ21_OP11001000349 [Microgenomates bacterium OLB22]
MRMEISLSKEQPGQIEQLESAIRDTLTLYGAEGKVSVTTGTTRSGRPRIELHGPAKKTLIDDLGVVERMLRGDFMLTASLLAKTLDTIQAQVNTTDLLRRPAFEQSDLFSKKAGGNGNELLNKLTDSPASSIPTFYGSTSGLNMAEVFETVVCADTAQTRGHDTHVVFDTMGHTTPRAVAMLEQSKKVLPTSAWRI